MDRWLQFAHGGHKRALISIFTAFFCLLVSGLALGMPAYPGAVTVSQPDGTEIVIRGFGDEHFHWTEDANGYTIVQKGGWYQYATIDKDGRLGSTGLNVGLDDPSASGISKGVLPSATIQAQSRLEDPNVSQGVPSTETVNNLVILVRFSNHTNRTQPSVANINVLMNAVSPDAQYAPTGSLRALYLENSYGALTLDSTVANWKTVSNSEAYYADGVSGSSLLHDALREALIEADTYIDFDQFDADNDGWIDAITFLHSGYGAEWSGNDAYGTPQIDRIWSHKWSMSTWTSGEGVKVSSYHISPAVWGTSGNAIGRVGVIAHETGHFLGLPDMYDTNGGGEGIGSWGLMANSWDFNFTQHCPPHFSPYSKEILGWTTPTVITNPGQYTLNQAEFNAEVYKVEAGFPGGEYLLIENRQNAGFDCTIPQGGLVIWHIDEDGSVNHNTEGYPNQGGWPGNGAHYTNAVLQADGNYDLEKGNNRGDAGDTFHGSGMHAIGPGVGNPILHPNTDTYQDGIITQTGHVISDISNSDASMTFCLNGCVGLTAPSNLAATAGGIDTINLTWTDNSGPDETGFTISRSLDGTNWSDLTNVAANITAYGDFILSSGTTYFYRVRAFDATSTSGWSSTASATTDDEPPTTPSFLTAASNGENEINLLWGDVSDDEDGFRIERSTSESSEFGTVTTVGVDVTAYSDTGLTAGATYYYRVYAFNTFDSVGFAAANAKTDDPDPLVRYNAYRDQFGSGLVSGDYTATHADGGAVQWIEEKVSGGKKRDRTTYMGHFWRFNITPGDTITVKANAYQSASGDGDTFDFAWSDTDVTSSYQFLFNVDEENDDNLEMGTIPGEVSGEVWIRVLDTDRSPGNSSSRDRIYVDELYIEVFNVGPPSAPATPTGLTVTNVGFTSIDIGWTDVANNETNYRVEGSDDGANWTQIGAPLPLDSVSFSEGGLGNGVTRYYRVRAANDIGFSGYTNPVVSATTQTPQPPPTAPTGLSATLNVDGYSDVTLNWAHSDADTSEDGFRVQRSTDGGTTYPNTFVAGGPNTLFYVDSSVAPNTTYTYRVHAYNNTASAWSDPINITTLSGPANLVLDSVSGSKSKGKKQFHLTWSPSGGAADIDVYINSVHRGSVPDTGTETLGTSLKGGGVDNVSICPSEGGVCSNTLNVIW